MGTTLPGEPIITQVDGGTNATQPCSNSLSTLYGAMCPTASSEQLEIVRRVLQVFIYIAVIGLVIFIAIASIWRYISYRRECAIMEETNEENLVELCTVAGVLVYAPDGTQNIATVVEVPRRIQPGETFKAKRPRDLIISCPWLSARPWYPQAR
eukprot:jgi/Botrbrau1/9932/Bobra.0012s0029.1